MIATHIFNFALFIQYSSILLVLSYVDLLYILILSVYLPTDDVSKECPVLYTIFLN